MSEEKRTRLPPSDGGGAARRSARRSSRLTLSDVPRERLAAFIVRAEAENTTRAAQDRLSAYRPHGKQRQFHAAGAHHNERLFMAGNQLGKTLAGGMEWAIHLTGRYPSWWEGRRFAEAGRFWAAGETVSKVTRGRRPTASSSSGGIPPLQF